MTARPSGNLPVELTSFVGRRDDLTRARTLLGTARLLTLTGVGGVGKTRLALAVAASMRREFPDGVWTVELADLRQTGLLTQTLCGLFGVTSESSDAFGTLAEHLRTKKLLLVLDNCEHLIDACAEVVGRLLSVAPAVKILATSRQVLGVEGEQLFPVSPLTLGSPGGLGEAMQLFEERASAAQPDFRVTEDNRAAVEEICRRLEGLPLAIELAAANIRVFGPAEIAARLGDSAMMMSSERNRSARHRTLESVVDWSYQLCSPRERQVWEQLSVFAGGFTAETADGVCLPSETGAGVLRELIGLLDKSMIVRVDEDHELQGRYRLLEPMRQYALAKLESSSDATAVRMTPSRPFPTPGPDLGHRLLQSGRRRVVPAHPHRTREHPGGPGVQPRDWRRGRGGRDGAHPSPVLVAVGNPAGRIRVGEPRRRPACRADGRSGECAGHRQCPRLPRR
ncbi:ATP-binding protein [Gordonia amicalis]|uniref:ATP-binding protein n=1 Tax=Gordonia amicalis TaxID=89053 RepID=UPI0002A65496|nr:AAA family ATPase [Gordonia amicalis]MDV7172222.1 AAA family ATPase [Gordonia amicalis]UOG22168.1 AAA family ATPase [Gordonia amicalis]GAC53317.1 putative LuxR family transcriptional regulator [Gordonia amicalis NBRC 100051 = JCM 11271]